MIGEKKSLNFSKERLNCLYSPKIKKIYGLLLTGFLAIASGCTSQGNNTAKVTTGQSSPVAATTVKFDKQILSNFTDQVVIPTYQEFAIKAKELSQTIDKFVKNPNEKSLQAAQVAWVEARSPWEQSECFSFGPATSLGYDGELDTWPVNETDFRAIIKSKDSLTADYIKKVKETEKGFHVIEYILFGNGKNRQVSDLSKRELNYLQFLGADFARVASNLSNSWSKGIEGKPAYREVIVTAGESKNSTYPTEQAGIQEMVVGMIDSLGEVADSKIGEAFEKKDNKLAESRFSFNTLTDMKHNVQGAQNVYLGSFTDANGSAEGLSAYLAKVNPALDQKIKQQFTAATDALSKIPEPFEKSVVNGQQAQAIKAAQEAVKTLSETIEKEVKPLVVGDKT